MDLLGSILGSMNGPPQTVLSEKEKERRKRQKVYQEKLLEKRRVEMEAFRSKIEKDVEKFLKECLSEKSKTFPTMNQYHRSILKDVCEVAGLVAYSFGEEEVNRHIVVWKQEFAPSEEELACHRRGEKYDPQEIERRKVILKAQEVQERKEDTKSKPSQEPKVSYLDKFKGLIETGNPEAVNAKKSYGMVSAESKKDKRTVEEVQAEIRAKKRAKLDES
uniref:Sperm-associated antigen 7 n=1 Tax=Lepeophtheirus salmonis TaxID=72036 RepID=C1BVN3_LEPSM|nr:Sperm-associated antigen 7 [Lepeophtheirus salmonis]